MSHALIAKWRTQPGTEDRVLAILAEMTHLTRQEPGCLMYQAHRSLDDARLFILYEQYVDEAAMHAHSSSDYFKRLVLGEAIPLLESRERQVCVTIDL